MQKMSTMYGTISTAPLSSFPNSYSYPIEWIRSGVGIRRPWKEMISFSFSFPETFNLAFQRIKTNMSYFHVNYAIIILFMVFFSLLWHPISLIVFLVTMAAWLFLYFLRDTPVIVFGYAVEERVILVVLSIFTMVLLCLTHATVFMVGMVVGFAVVAAHGLFRRTDDLILLDLEQGGERVDLKETASASYSSH